MSSDEKNNEMTPVNHRIALTRRAALGICAGTAATWLMSPLAAFASYDNLGGVDIGSCRVWDWSEGGKRHDFGSEGDIVGDYFQMNYGNSGYTKNTSWMKWNMWDNNWLGTALCLEAKTDYENALFSHVTYYPLVAGLSAMEYESYRHWGWQPSGRDDSYYELQQSINGAVTTLATHSFDTDTTTNTVKGYNDYDIVVHTSGGDLLDRLRAMGVPLERQGLEKRPLRAFDRRPPVRRMVVLLGQALRRRRRACNGIHPVAQP